MRLKDTIDFIGLWEILNNENFNRVEFDAVKLESGKANYSSVMKNTAKLEDFSEEIINNLRSYLK